MAFPSEERLKILQEAVADLQRYRNAPQNYEDTTFHGVVTGIKTLEPADALVGDTTGDGSECPHRYVEVAPYFPIVSSAGHLEFDADEHPLTEVDEDTRREKVFVLNVPSHLIDLYFPVGEVIDYWRYSGQGEDTEAVRGSYVTRKEDKGIWAKIDWTGCACAPPSPEGCEARNPTLSRTSFQYKWTAVVEDASATSLAQKFKTFYPCEGSEFDATPITGFAYNLAEVLNLTSAAVNKTGTGVDVYSDGRRTDEAEPKYLLPVGPQVVKLYPFIDPNTGRCDYTEWYFGPIPNEFGSQAPASQCLYCIYAYTAKLLCGETPEWDLSYGGNTGGCTGVSYDGQNCGRKPDNLGQWKKYSTGDGYCIYQYFRLGDCCTATEASCPDPSSGDCPALPDDIPEDCCDKKCIFHLTLTYDCAAEEGSQWGTITQVGVVCDFPSGIEGAWIQRPIEGTVVTWDYYLIGDPCAAVETCELSPGDYPEFPDTPTDICTKKCIQHFTITYDCSAEEGSRWGDMTYVDSVCDYAPANATTWIMRDRTGSVVTWDYYQVGPVCTTVGDCPTPSGGEYPQYPDTPSCFCPVPCPPSSGTYALIAIDGVMQWVETTSECP